LSATSRLRRAVGATGAGIFGVGDVARLPLLGVVRNVGNTAFSPMADGIVSAETACRVSAWHSTFRRALIRGVGDNGGRYWRLRCVGV